MPAHKHNRRVKLFAEIVTVPVVGGKATWTNDIAALNIVRAELWDGSVFKGVAQMDVLPRVFAHGETLAMSDVTLDEEESFIA